jgi:hypothetical protein
VYCNETYGLPQVRAAFIRQGVAEPHYWCANYDNQPILRAGEVARQYANPTLTGRHYDVSVVADYWPGVDGTHGDPTQGDSDLTPDENLLLKDIWSVLRTGTRDADAPHGPVFLADQFTAVQTALAKPEPAETEPAPTTPLIDPKVAADLATVAGFLRKFGQ